ncbi:MAG: GDP-mannose 4,6-dehydratase [Solirubrobacterales bacterium]|nr:GDP-mannose 4,6-dehydratase [Solirubrobacterales bacterium]
MKVFLYIVSCLAILVSNLHAIENAPETGTPLKKALIFGVTGQDGIYLAEFLLDKNYEVHGVKRSDSKKNANCIDMLLGRNSDEKQRFVVHYGDLRDKVNTNNLICTIMPDEVYNLAAQSHVKDSFDVPAYTIDVNGLGVLHILESIRMLNTEKSIRFYQASTSELFGKVHEIPQTELTPFYPRSPYGVAKLCAHWISINYREAYNVFSCNGILFNHESPLRDETFVTRKITLAASRYKYGLQDILYIGNLNAKRDWGYAKDYVEVMWLMLQQSTPEDYVIATGINHTVREFIEQAYKYIGVDIKWYESDQNEYGIDTKTGKVIVAVKPEFFRPTEVDVVLGNAEKARNSLKWMPKTSFNELLQIMMESDLKKISKEIER